MRSVIKKTGIALVAVLGLSLSACASTAPEAFDASTVSCETVVDEITSAEISLQDAEDYLTEVSGTPSSIDAQAEVDTAQQKLDALTERSKECDGEGNEEAVPEPNDCPARFRQVDVGHNHNRVIDDFQDRYEAFMLDRTPDKRPLMNFLLREAGKSAEVLAFWSSGLGLYDDANAYEPLLEGDCLSSEGQDLWQMLKGALSSNETEITVDAAPTNGTNSGYENGQFGTAHGPGIAGDTTGIQITREDGTVWIMFRCGNMVWYVPPPLLPKVATDDPYVRGNADTGGGPNDDKGPGEKKELEQPGDAPYVPPAAPTPTPTPVPTVVTPATPTPQPTVTPSAEPPNNGYVPGTAPTDAPCSVEFGTCP